MSRYGLPLFLISLLLLAHHVTAAPDAPIDYTLHLGERSFDPLSEAYLINPLKNSGRDLWLVQFEGAVRATWLERLTAMELDVVQYIHPYSYVVWGEGTQLAEATREVAAVRWAGPFAAEYRALPSLVAAVEPLGDHPFELLLYRRAEVSDIHEAITALGGTVTATRPLGDKWHDVTFRLAGTHLAAIAQLPGVYTIQSAAKQGGSRGEWSTQINVGRYATDNVPEVGYLAWLAEAGVTGQGVVLANVDEGIDEAHADLNERMVACTGSSCGGDILSTHGTHTAGIMVGDGRSGLVDGQGFLRGLGVAPGASLVEQIYLHSMGGLYDMAELMAESVRNGAIISNNSWGPASTPQGYDLDTMKADMGVRDADPLAVGDQPLTYVLAIMNGFGGTSTQGSPDEAKNIITVGSTRARDFNGAPILSVNDVSVNSGHGPALDGRIIPHLVAPGAYVDSTQPSNGYGYSLGTSMAAPQVSGAAALFVERYRQQHGHDPSPALIKAALLGSAHNLQGHLDANHQAITARLGPQQGWGRLNVADLVAPATRMFSLDQTHVFTDTGQVWSQTLMAADLAQPMRLMLTWTDAPGPGLGGNTPAWSNDLDLQVTINDTTYWGNQFGSDGWSQSGGMANFQNNMEGVFLAPHSLGNELTVTVQASHLAADGVPSLAGATDQDFALVCFNCGRTYRTYLPLLFH